MEYILSIVTIEALGDWSFTKYVQGDRKNIWYKLLGYVSYVGLLEFFQKSIEVRGLAWTNSAWDGWSNLTTGLVAFVLFNEKPTLKQFVGMVLISVGLFFLGNTAITTYGTNNGKK